jgi:molybdenum cofactor cytidylyltransferase
MSEQSQTLGMSAQNSVTSASTKAVGLLLAAGRGSRFDPSGAKSKLLQTIDGLPIVCHAAATLLATCTNVLAVVRPHSAELKLWLREAGCHVVECADAHSGMGHSLAWGLAEAERLYNPEILVVMLGDMPYVKPATIKTLIYAINDEVQAVAPEFMGRRGNPGVFGKSHFAVLGQCRGDRGAAAVLKPHEVQLINVPDPGVLNDIDSPADLASAATHTHPTKP